MMFKKKFAAVALIAVPMLALSGCSKPEAAEVKTAVMAELTDSGLDQATAEQVADCAAPKLTEELSASTLNKIVDDGFSGSAAADDVDAAEKIMKDCVTEFTGS